jgi:hypothetical protein
MLIDFRSRETGKPVMKEHERDRDDCFSFSMPGGTKGRVWIDSSTHDVVRVEERLVGPVDFRPPASLLRRPEMPPIVTLDRYDRYVRYKPVHFDEPSETMLLPEQVDEITVFRPGGGHRTVQSYSNYKRFLTGGRIIRP